MLDSIFHHIAQVRNINPLIVCITNYVTMDFMANGLLAIGASPIMAHAPEELDELIQQAHAVVINIGTPDQELLKSFETAAASANRLNKCVVLDPVGSGASQLRTQISRHLMREYRMDVVRGNASEITSLYADGHTTKGVESTLSVHDAMHVATHVANLWDSCIIISGRNDLILSREEKYAISAGSPMMTHITGMGCLLTAVVAAFCAVAAPAHRVQAARDACAYFSMVGELAEIHGGSYGPASFKQAFLNLLFKVDKNHFAAQWHKQADRENIHGI